MIISIKKYTVNSNTKIKITLCLLLLEPQTFTHLHFEHLGQSLTRLI